MNQVEIRRRLVVSEVQQMVLASQMIPVEEAMTLFQTLLKIVDPYVPAPKDRQTIAEEFTALINDRSRWGRRLLTTLHDMKISDKPRAAPWH